jgi:hypothetical protein
MLATPMAMQRAIQWASKTASAMAMQLDETTAMQLDWT